MEPYTDIRDGQWGAATRYATISYMAIPGRSAGEKQGGVYEGKPYRITRLAQAVSYRHNQVILH